MTVFGYIVGCIEYFINCCIVVRVSVCVMLYVIQRSTLYCVSYKDMSLLFV
jgi:hypothetical protein